MEVKKSADIVALPLGKGGNSAVILNLVKDRVDDKMDYLLSGLHENIADALFEEMLEMGADAARTSHFNIMRAMKVEQSRYRQQFRQRSDSIWAAFPTGLTDTALPPMELDVAEVMNPLCHRVRVHYKVGIRDVQQRFQTLLHRDLTINPLSPDFYYRSFWAALQDLELKREERVLIMPLFHRFVMDRYGQVLGAASRTLIELKVAATDQLPTSSQ